MSLDGISGVGDLSPLPQPGGFTAEQQGEERRVAEQFTSILMTMVVREMWKSVSVDGNSPFGNGPGAEIYRGLAENAFAESLSRHGVTGITAEVERFIERSRAAAESDT